MLLEVFGLYGIFLLVLFAYAEIAKKPPVGLIASVLLIPLSVWLISDGLQIKTGEIISATETNVNLGNISTILNGNQSVNLMNESIYTELLSGDNNATSYIERNQRMINVYTDIPATYGVQLSTVLGIAGFALFLYGSLRYTLEVDDYSLRRERKY
jgi:hypothetical protein